MRRALVLGVALVASAVAPAASQFGRPLPIVEPFEALVVIGTSQPFQLLDSSGNEILSDDWSVSDPKIASLAVEGGHAILTGRAAGTVSLSIGSGGRSGEIQVRPADGTVQESRWILRPLDGRFVSVLWAASTWGTSVDGNNYSGTTASYYYEDRGPQSSHVRAIRRDGLQLWQWPKQAYRESPHMLSGDFTGGILMTAGAGAKRELFSVDIAGEQRWRVPAPGFSGTRVNVTQLNVVYFVSDDADGKRVVGLNGRTGEQVFTVSLDAGREVRRNLQIRAGRIVCAPGVENTSPSPLRTTPVITNAMGVTNVAYADWSINADAGSCTAGAAVAPADVRLHVTQRLVMLDIGQDFVATSKTIEQGERDTTGRDATIEVIAPMNEMIVGPDGTGNYLPLRKSVRGWPSADETTREEFIYRVSSDRRQPMYRVTLPRSPDPGNVGLLLGDNNNPAYVSRGRTVMAFETADGRERWRWTSQKANVDAVSSLKGDALLVREGDGYTIVEAGHKVASRSEAFMLFVMKFLPDFNRFALR
jgi:hypothetical protein